MTVTAKDLRFQTSMLFDLLAKGEEVLITYRGKAKAKLIPYDNTSNEEKSDELFGMLKDENTNVSQVVRSMRSGRNFDI